MFVVTVQGGKRSEGEGWGGREGGGGVTRDKLFVVQKAVVVRRPLYPPMSAAQFKRLRCYRFDVDCFRWVRGRGRGEREGERDRDRQYDTETRSE